MSNKTTPQPPTLTRKFVKLILGFGVSVAVGLAPYLGKIGIPGFDALLTLLPRSIESIVLPVSAALMGLIAVWVQWNSFENFKIKYYRRNFKMFLILFTSFLFTLMIVHTLLVVKIDVPAANDSVSFLIGINRPYREPCPSGISNADCIKRLTFDEAKIAGFWGDNQIKISQLLLIFSYILTTSTFGALIGLLLLWQEYNASLKQPQSGKKKLDNI